MRQHRRPIAALRWIGSGAIVLGLMGGLGGMGAGAVAPVMRVSQQAIAEAGASAGDAALEEGIRFYKQQTAESLRAAIVKLEEAVKLFRAAKKPKGEAASLVWAGSAYKYLGEKQKALEYFNQALHLMRAVGHRAGEAITLIYIGAVYNDLGEKQKARIFKVVCVSD